MRIIHRFGFRLTDEERAPFQEIGIDLPEGVRLAGDALVAFEIAEDDSRWSDVRTVLGNRKKMDLVWTEFSLIELEAAEFLVMHTKSPMGYPQPEKYPGYLTATYDLTDFCEFCALGLQQKAPFRFKRSPTLRSKTMFQLYWIPDEFFAPFVVWESLFKPLGIGARHPVINKTGATIGSVVQLDIQKECDVRTESLDPLDCAKCGRRKYKFPLRGYCPEPATKDFEMAKSSLCFGEGAFANRLVVVSRALRRRIREAGVTGVEFFPCAGNWINTLDPAQLKNESPIRKRTISKASLTPEQLRIVELIESLENEVNNGGFDQFFYNSAGDDTSEIIQALKTVRAVKMASIVTRAAAKFPVRMPPKDRARRQDVLLRVSPDGDAFAALDDAFYQYPDDLADLLRKYVSH